jgi:hypothetical protein
MKKLAILALAAVALSACQDNHAPIVGPGANFELVAGHGSTVEFPNVRIYARFGFTEGSAVSVDQYVGPGINEEGKEMGECLNGRWKNPGGRFAGATPHMHCVRGAGASQQDVIEMELISGEHWVRSSGSGRTVEKLVFGTIEVDGKVEDLLVEYLVASTGGGGGSGGLAQTKGKGLIVGHALKNGTRVGKFVFNLDQFNVANENLLDGECYIGETNPADDPGGVKHCLAYETEVGGEQVLTGQAQAYYFRDVNAAHTDLTTADRTVNGFIYWEEIE